MRDFNAFQLKRYISKTLLKQLSPSVRRLVCITFLIKSPALRWKIVTRCVSLQDFANAEMSAKVSKLHGIPRSSRFLSKFAAGSGRDAAHGVIATRPRVCVGRGASIMHVCECICVWAVACLCVRVHSCVCIWNATVSEMSVPLKNAAALI